MSSAWVFVNHTRDGDTKGTDRFISTCVSSAEGFLPTNWTSFREKSDRQMLASDPNAHRTFKAANNQSEGTRVQLPSALLDVVDVSADMKPLGYSNRPSSQEKRSRLRDCLCGRLWAMNAPG